MKIWAGAWLNASVTIDFTMATSSTTFARWGRSSDSSAPLLPCLANLNFGPRNVDDGLMNAARYPLIRSGGGGLPSYFASSGLLSKSSRWLGARP